MMQSSSTWKPQTDKPYICTKCGKGLSHIFTLNRHHKTVCGKMRNASGKWKCEHCPKSYETEGNLVRHVRYECGVPRQFSCIFCSKSFTQRSSLSRHLKKFHLREMFHNSSGYNLAVHNTNAAVCRELILAGNDSESAHGSFSSDRNQSYDGFVAQRELDSASNDSDSVCGSSSGRSSISDRDKQNQKSR